MSDFERIHSRFTKHALQHHIYFSEFYDFSLNFNLLEGMKMLNSGCYEYDGICVENWYVTFMSAVALENTILINLAIYLNC